ncbi:MAG: hypothetical protein P4L51_11800 [Puia sp.]|nr:hypothetical protein [Puia sp.]
MESGSRRLNYPLLLALLSWLPGLSKAQPNFKEVDDWLAANTPKMGGRSILVMILDKAVLNGKRILSEQSIAQMQENRIGPGHKKNLPEGEAPLIKYH